ncbi:DUF6161 domain-containing protein [Seonamhaeicola sp. ML3]|uniref:DUF6161 domain-containing protein n=1 Tax=Seonamhaeicola sp. ML3 TaxID=2937786 RepID=UPI00200DD17B|nr:DUF6161 domain-containing protein [Seonamhaeicola sp. ML3]
MTTTEIRKIITKSENAEWFNTIEVSIEYPKINFSKRFKGVSSLHRFLTEQVKGWEKYGNSIPNELSNSKRHFTNLKSRIENFVDTRQNDHQSNLVSYWRNEQTQLQSYNQNSPFFTYDSPQTEFLIDVHNKFPSSFQGAYLFTIGQHRTNNRDELIGAILAYEFELKDHTEITQRRDKEKASISRLRNDFEKHIVKSENELTEHLTNANKEYENYTDKIDELKNNKETAFDEWYSKIQNKFSAFDSDSKKKISDLEKTYEELLRLKKPAEYWKTRASTLKSEGWKAIYWLIGLVIFACVTLYLLLWLTPEGMLLSFVKGNTQAIKWSIIYITFISFLAFGIRALNKVAFSSFHLARDAEEREQLTYVYLALIKDKAVDEKDKNLIIQSLFSRADTGLLKDDSGPTMPNDFTGKILGR